MSSNFILLEIVDAEINSFFWAIDEAIVGTRPTRPVHITLRGPYERPVPNNVIERCREAMRHDVLEIGEVDTFANEDEHVVFFRVNSPNLRDVWWKRDYSIHEFGFNPHISVYQGKDSVFAATLVEFLRAEKLRLLCAEFRIVGHLSRQKSLLSYREVDPQFLGLVNSGRVSTTFRRRLDQLVSSFRKPTSTSSE